MGKYHYNLYSEINDISKVALCDIDNRALETIVINGNKETIIRNDYHDILEYVDAVTIAAPTKCHYDIAKECLKAGKHVLVEKPITTNYDEAKELFDIAQKNNLVLHSGHVERFNGAFRSLKSY